MSTTAQAVTGARLSVMLSELRLPTIKRMAAQLCDQSDREGWPGRRLLEMLLEHELAERETRRIDRHRAESGLSPCLGFTYTVSCRHELALKLNRCLGTDTAVRLPYRRLKKKTGTCGAPVCLTRR